MTEHIGNGRTLVTACHAARQPRCVATEIHQALCNFRWYRPSAIKREEGVDGAFNLSLYSTSAFITGLTCTSSGPVPGFAVASGSISGTGTVMSFVSAVSGSSFDLTLALLAASYPGPGGAAGAAVRRRRMAVY